MALIIDEIVRKSIRTKVGRHKLYYSCRWPWFSRASYYNVPELDEEAFEKRRASGDNTPFLKYAWPPNKYEFLPEDEFWVVVFTCAREHKLRRAKALQRLLSAPFDPLADPPHPLCRVKPQ